ncbi:MAG TPA: hypothetical protein VL400_08370 [Polyangiaceae bacterium]|nr:hypothetical protein [Polyangiaceae bacterium]
MTHAGLACLDGLEAPPGLAADLVCLAELPAPAKEAFAPVLDLVLADVVQPGTEARLAALAEERGADPVALTRAAMAARLLLRAAARTDVGLEQLEADVRGLVPGAAEAVLAVLGRSFEPAKARIQSELLARTVKDHGKVLADFDWRLETITQSSHGRGFRLPLVTLTLRYEENGRQEAITLHVLPTVLKKLRAVLGRLVE